MPSDSRDTGAVLVTTALMVFVLMLFAALATDVPVLMNERRTAQNAADHAALSASWADCNGEDPLAAAQTSVVNNGYQAGELTLDNPGGSTYESRIDTTSDSFFAKVIGVTSLAVGAEAAAECETGSGGSTQAVFALGDTCSSYGKNQIDTSGSNQTIYGGIHSNDNVDIGGSDNDFGPGNPPPTDSFTYVSTFNEGGSGNGYDPSYPAAILPLASPVNFMLADFDTGGSEALVAGATGQYFRVDGDIDGDYIQSNGSGLYYATGDIVLDKTVNLAVTLVAEGVVEISGSNQVLTPFSDGLLIFGGHPYTGIDQCDKFVVSMGGSTQNWTGLIYGPHGLVEMNGSSNTTLVGSLIGFAVKLNGSNISIISDPDLFPPDDPIVKLTQ